MIIVFGCGIIVFFGIEVMYIWLVFLDYNS